VRDSAGCSDSHFIPASVLRREEPPTCTHGHTSTTPSSLIHVSPCHTHPSLPEGLQGPHDSLQQAVSVCVIEIVLRTM
jgi:hypothetical protein